jgi:hypothetical protein
MANEPKKGFTWEDADKQAAAAPAAGGGNKPFSWNDVPEPPTPASTSLEQGAPKTTFTGAYNPNAEKYGPVVRALDAAGGAVMGAPSAILSTIAHPIDTAKGIGQSAGQWFDPKTRPTWEGIKSVLPEALGMGIGNVAAGEATPPLTKLVGEGVGAAAKPIVKLGMEEATGQPKALTKLVLGGERARALSEMVAPKDEAGMPYEQKAQNLMRRGREQDALDRQAARQAKLSPPTPETNAEGVAAPTADVIKVPVPRELQEGEKVGYNASTPRKLLLDNALQGRPGAAEMLRNAGKTPLFVEEGGYAPPKSKMSFGNVANPGDFTANRNITLNPVGETGARPIVSPAHQFESSFGPEHQEVGDLAEWETGNREGVRPLKKIISP